MEKNLAPIVLFVYNRLNHTKRTIEALKNNFLAEKSELFIFSDGPKRKEDVIKVKEVRKYIHHLTGFKQVNVMERAENYGLAQSIVTGVNEIISQYGKVIVLEDDLITDINFLTYMNEGLIKYQEDTRVFSVTGYSYLKKGPSEPFFLKICSSWSWGTWKDRWQKYDLSCKGWEVLKSDRQLRKKFNYDNSYPFYNLLEHQIKDHRTNSWAIIWYWTVFKNEGLTLYPPISLVNNVGFDGSGEHCGTTKTIHENFLCEHVQKEWELDSDVLELPRIRKQASKAIWWQTTPMEKILLIKGVCNRRC